MPTSVSQPFDPSLVDSISCVLVEPVPNDETSKTVTGEGMYHPGSEHRELINILSKCELPWSHEVINKTCYVGYGHQKVMGWAFNMTIGDFLSITKAHRPTFSIALKDWFKEVGRYGQPVELRVMCPKKIWTSVDHLKGDYQDRAGAWASACFGADAAIDQFHRRNRFIEEAIELHQASGGTADEVAQLVDHVYAKPIGAPRQEAGGCLLTLATLCNALDLDLLHAGEDELARVWDNIIGIRAKQATAQAVSPLPGNKEDA